MKSKINVYSEIGKLKTVLVHRPGDEISYLTPNRLNELLFSAILEPETAIKEHDEFVKILKNHGVKVVQLIDLVDETFKQATDKEKNDFINKFISEINLGKNDVLTKEIEKKIKNYLLSFKNSKKMISKMISGILSKEINVNYEKELIVDPMPNIYFTRDPFSCIGNGVSINKMKYPTRQRETIFADFIFKCNRKYKNTPIYFDRNQKWTIEGGDIFIYTNKTLVIGVSERTNIKAIEIIAKNIKNNAECDFNRIIAINVPAMPNLMHLDTWLTMIDYDKFLFSPNMLKELKIWEIDLSLSKVKIIEKKDDIKSILKSIINKEPIMIPIAGENASQMSIDIETHFDGTNYLVLEPGVVVGYDRNKQTENALKKAGIKVYSFKGNQLSLGMGSTRCMSMPLERESILNYKNKKTCN